MLVIVRVCTDLLIRLFFAWNNVLEKVQNPPQNVLEFHLVFFCVNPDVDRLAESIHFYIYKHLSTMQYGVLWQRYLQVKCIWNRNCTSLKVCHTSDGFVGSKLMPNRLYFWQKRYYVYCLVI